MTNKAVFKIFKRFEVSVLKMIFLIFLISHLNILIGQTYISPIIGCDFQKVVSSKVIEIKFKNKGYSHINPFIGIKIEQKFYNSILLNYNGLYSYKKVNGYYDAGFYFQDLVFKYHYNQNSFGIGYLLMNRLYFCISKTYSNVLEMKIVDIYNDFETESPPKRIKEQGLKFYAGFNYKKFNLGMYYYYRSYTDPIRDSFYQFLEKTSSIGFEMSYNFKILNTIKIKKNNRCPDFKSNK